MKKDVKRVEAIYKRKSTRAFQNKPIFNSTLYEIIQAGTKAPASGNMQPWEFIIIDQVKMKKRVLEQTFSGFYSKNRNHQEWILDAGVIIVACTNFKRTLARYGSLAYEWALLDTAASIQNMLLTATELGFASCWVGGFCEKGIKHLLTIPDYVRPIGLIPIGLPSKEGFPKQKLQPEWVTHDNCYNKPFFKM